MSVSEASPTLLLWVARVAWLFTAIAGGAAVDAATSDRSSSVRWVAAIGGWTLWALVALALAIVSVRSLTAVRLLAPIGLIVTVASGVGGATALQLTLLGLPTFIAVTAVFTAGVGRVFVQSTAYGDEDRLLLRPPVAAGAAALITWVVWSPAVVAGPLLLAARSWVVGAIVTAVALAGMLFVGPRWHRLALRWLVFVPAGLVVHDPIVLADTLMLRTRQVKRMRLAPADTDAADLTGPASGYALEISTTESVSTVFAFTPSEPQGKSIHLTAFLVSPSRPGAALLIARERGIPVE